MRKKGRINPPQSKTLSRRRRAAYGAWRPPTRPAPASVGLALGSRRQERRVEDVAGLRHRPLEGTGRLAHAVMVTPAVRISRGVFPVQRLNACVNALTS